MLPSPFSDARHSQVALSRHSCNTILTLCVTSHPVVCTNTSHLASHKSAADTRLFMISGIRWAALPTYGILCSCKSTFSVV